MATDKRHDLGQPELESHNAPSARSMTSSKSSKVSGCGCSRLISTVACRRCATLPMARTIWYVVELSSPVYGFRALRHGLGDERGRTELAHGALQSPHMTVLLSL